MSIFEKQPLSRHLQLYEKVALGFAGVAFLLFLAVLYFSLARATVVAVAKPTTANAVMLAKIVPEPKNSDEIGGFYVEETFSQKKTFMFGADGARAVEGKAMGTVTLVNHSHKDQPLVATTRLLSKEGALFRLKDSVVVHQNEELEADVIADQPGQSSEIGPTSFTIPGLASSLQDQIYATSLSPMVGGLGYVRLLTQEDVDNGAQELQTVLNAQAQQTFDGIVPQQYKVHSMLFSGQMQKDIDVAVGDEVSGYTLTVTQKISAVYYDADSLLTLARNALEHRVPLGYKIVHLPDDSLTFTVDQSDKEAGTASVTVNVSGQAVVSVDAPIFDKQRFLGRTPEEVKTLLLSSGDIDSVSVSFSPFWLKRVPTLADHISIEVRDK